MPARTRQAQRTRRNGRAALALAVALGVAGPAAAQPESGGPTTVDRLVREGLAHNADGRYAEADAVWRRLAALYPEHPAPHVYGVETLYWRMVFDDDRHDFDAAIIAECEKGVAKAEAMVEADPDDAQGWFLLGQALTHLGRIHGVRLRVFRAGQLAERGREALERSLELDPTLVDAKYHLGMYLYYATLIPSLVQWLSFLWFIPTGDAEQGIAYLEDVIRDGDLHRFSASFFLTNIRTYHEAQLDRAWASRQLRALYDAHPHNVLLQFEWIELLVMLHRYEEAVAEARRLEAHPGDALHERNRKNVARIWRARAEMALGRSDAAWQTLAVFGPGEPRVPTWSGLWVELTRAQILDLRGERAKAVTLYQRVLQPEPGFESSRAAEWATAALEEPFALPTGAHTAGETDGAQ